MDIKKLVVTVVTTLTVGVLSWQLNTVNNLETDVEVMKYKIATLEKYVKKLQKSKRQMNFLDIWNHLTYADGILFSLWIGAMYYTKCWIDYKFQIDKKK